MATLTSANTVITLGATNFFPVPQQIQGFATDDIFTADAVDNAVTLMGADGRFSYGWVPKERRIVIALQADSPSNSFFDQLGQAENTNQDKYTIFGTITLPGLALSAQLVNGCLRNYKWLPDAKRMMMPRTYTMEFGKITIIPVGANG